MQGSSGESPAGKLAHMAADYLGGNDDSHSRHSDHKASGLKPTALSKVAADYLGVDASTVASVGRWWVLSSLQAFRRAGCRSKFKRRVGSVFLPCMVAHKLFMVGGSASGGLAELGLPRRRVRDALCRY
mgnify:CR=1 FL=1